MLINLSDIDLKLLRVFVAVAEARASAPRRKRC